MFAGIVEESAEVVRLSREGGGYRLVVRSGLDHSDTAIGDSIAIDGVCLTVVERDGGTLSFDLAEETVRRTILGTLSAGSRVNLERSLRLGERIHGHLVFGHVDGTIELVERRVEGSSERFSWRIPSELASYLAPKGSVSIAGVSLTVGEVGPDTFSVYIVPHTSAVTTLGKKRPGDQANLEVDMLARYVRSAVVGADRSGGVTEGFLAEHGFLERRG